MYILHKKQSCMERTSDRTRSRQLVNHQPNYVPNKLFTHLVNAKRQNRRNSSIWAREHYALILANYFKTRSFLYEENTHICLCINKHFRFFTIFPFSFCWFLIHSKVLHHDRLWQTRCDTISHSFHKSFCVQMKSFFPRKRIENEYQNSNSN